MNLDSMIRLIARIAAEAVIAEMMNPSRLVRDAGRNDQTGEDSNGGE